MIANIGINKTPTDTASAAGVSYLTYETGVGGRKKATLSGSGNKIFYYNISSWTGTIRFGIYSGTEAPYTQVATHDETKTWTAGWHEITIATPFNIVAGTSYAISVNPLTGGYLAYIYNSQSRCWRSTGGTPASWTDVSGTRSYCSASYLQYTVTPANTYFETDLTLRVGRKMWNTFPLIHDDGDSYSVSPALPAGLTLNVNTGVISGTPTAITADATYTVTSVKNSIEYDEYITIEVLAEPTTDTINVFADGTGDYTTLQSALDGYTYKHSMATNNRRVEFICRGKVHSGDDYVSLYNTSYDDTDRYNDIVIKADTGHKHNGVWSTDCARIARIQLDSVPNVTIKDMAIKSSGSGSAIVCHFLCRHVILDGNLCLNPDGVTNGGIVIDSTGTPSTDPVIIINNMTAGGNNGIRVSEVSNVFIANNTNLNHSSFGIESNSRASIFVENNYAGACIGGAYHAEGGEVEYYTSFADDLTGTDQTAKSVASCNFTSAVAESEDFKITEGSSLIDIGTDLNTNKYYPFTYDAAGNLQGSFWDVGAYSHYVAPEPSTGQILPFGSGVSGWGCNKRGWF